MLKNIIVFREIIFHIIIWIFYDLDDHINQNNTLTQRVMSNKGYYCWDRIAKKMSQSKLLIKLHLQMFISLCISYT